MGAGGRWWHGACRSLSISLFDPVQSRHLVSTYIQVVDLMDRSHTWLWNVFQHASPKESKCLAGLFFSVLLCFPQDGAVDNNRFRAIIIIWILHGLFLRTQVASLLIEFSRDRLGHSLHCSGGGRANTRRILHQLYSQQDGRGPMCCPDHL